MQHSIGLKMSHCSQLPGEVSPRVPAPQRAFLAPHHRQSAYIQCMPLIHRYISGFTLPCAQFSGHKHSSATR